MKHPPYNPFEPFSFNKDTCFLTGKKLDDSNRNFVLSIPEWILKRYNLEDITIVMLDSNRMKYKEMLLPASDEAVKAINELDEVTQKAFGQGYEAVIKLPEITLFQWMARVLYGVVYHDFVFAIRQHKERGTDAQPSPLLQRKLKNLHFMLQSLIRPVKFKDFTPWTIRCYQVNISKDIFNYKDEPHRLNFCLGMNGFGIIACLQDNGEVATYHQKVLEKVGSARLHPAQFEELYGLFIYANYLLREIPDYKLTEEGDSLVFHLPDFDRAAPLFAEWKDETFAQVLANLWQPWGITLEKIYTFPNSPISYLIDESTNEFIKPERVTLPF